MTNPGLNEANALQRRIDDLYEERAALQSATTDPKLEALKKDMLEAYNKVSTLLGQLNSEMDKQRTKARDEVQKRYLNIDQAIGVLKALRSTALQQANQVS